MIVDEVGLGFFADSSSRAIADVSFPQNNARTGERNITQGGSVAH